MMNRAREILFVGADADLVRDDADGFTGGYGGATYETTRLESFRNAPGESRGRAVRRLDTNVRTLTVRPGGASPFVGSTLLRRRRSGPRPRAALSYPGRDDGAGESDEGDTPSIRLSRQNWRFVCG